MANRLKSEAEIGEYDAEMVCSVDKKRTVLDRVLLDELPKELSRRPPGSSGIEPSVEEFVRFGIDSGVQPVTLVTELNHRLVNRDVIRATSADRLSIGLPNPVVNRCTTLLDTQLLKCLFSIRE